MNKKRLLMLVEIAIFVAIGIILDKISLQFWAQGGSISLVMVPIMLMAYRWGLVAGLVTGLLVGILQVIFGGQIYYPIQGLLDYGVAFTVVGLAAIVRKPLLSAARQNQRGKIASFLIIGAIVGGALRLVTHTVAGAIFFAEYAGDQNPWLYSIIYNGSYMVPATIVTAIVCAILFTAAPKLLQQNS